MSKKTVLFISTRNNCRSLIAEAYLNFFAGGEFEAESAGLLPQEPDESTREAMKEENIDISGHVPRSVFEVKNSGKFFNYVILTCGRETVAEVPDFPGSDDHIKWNIDGAFYSGLTYPQKLALTKKIRDEIRSKVIGFLQAYKK